METISSINTLNILNLVFYVLNIFFTYAVGTAGLFGNPTNGELSEKYQTLVTPKGSAFSIWGIIFISQAIFAILQMLPKYRGKKMVQEGVKYFYVLTCVFQIGWTLAFSYEIIWLSLVFMISIWGSLVAVLYSQYYTESEGTIAEFWLLRFPFAIHCGWLTAASALNVNVLVVDINPPADVQLAVGIISLAVLHAISVWVLFGIRNPNYTISCVLAWANGWIYAELQQPKDQIVNRFTPDIINGVSYAALAVCIIVLTQVVVRVVYDLVKGRQGELDAAETRKLEVSDGSSCSA